MAIALGIDTSGTYTRRGAPFERVAFLRLKDATQYAREKGKNIAISEALRAGAADPKVLVEEKDLISRVAGESYEVLLERRIQITVSGHPQWEENQNEG